MYLPLPESVGSNGADSNCSKFKKNPARRDDFIEKCNNNQFTKKYLMQLFGAQNSFVYFTYLQAGAFSPITGEPTQELQTALLQNNPSAKLETLGFTTQFFFDTVKNDFATNGWTIEVKEFDDTNISKIKISRAYKFNRGATVNEKELINKALNQAEKDGFTADSADDGKFFKPRIDIKETYVMVLLSIQASIISTGLENLSASLRSSVLQTGAAIDMNAWNNKQETKSLINTLVNNLPQALQKQTALMKAAKQADNMRLTYVNILRTMRVKDWTKDNDIMVFSGVGNSAQTRRYVSIPVFEKRSGDVMKALLLKNLPKKMVIGEYVQV